MGPATSLATGMTLLGGDQREGVRVQIPKRTDPTSAVVFGDEEGDVRTCVRRIASLTSPLINGGLRGVELGVNL